MPRPALLRKDLSRGWRMLHRRWGETLQKKIAYSQKLISEALNAHRQPVVCWSGGKDSTVVLHLVLKCAPRVPVVFVRTGVDFPETIDFVKKIRKQWHLNLRIANPDTERTFWDIGRQYGWPIFGKGIASNVERARRTGNIRPQLSVLEKRLVGAKLYVSCKCAEIMQEGASKGAEEYLHADAKFVGLRAEESRARVRLWVDHGDHYYVKRYYGRDRGIWKVNPIATWLIEDIWEYHKRYGLPMCELYRTGYPRNGCWPCAMGIRNGQLERLRIYHPALFRRLLLQTPMGSELVRAAHVLRGKTPKSRYGPKEVEALLRADPRMFDLE